MPESLDSQLGKVRIADEVIAAVAGAAAVSCYGLVGMAARNVQDGLSELLGQDQIDRGVRVRLDADGSTVVDLFVVVQYGVNIAEVAENVKEQVRYQVERMLGLKVRAVNVHVQGVRVERPEREGRAPATEMA